jgi:hypothetical protein
MEIHVTTPIQIFDPYPFGFGNGADARAGQRLMQEYFGIPFQKRFGIWSNGFLFPKLAGFRRFGFSFGVDDFFHLEQLPFKRKR